MIREDGAPGFGGTLSDAFVRLYNSGGIQVASDDDSGTGLDSQIIFTPGASGTYYVDAGAFADGLTGTYRVSVVDQSQIHTNLNGDGTSDFIFQSGGTVIDWTINTDTGQASTTNVISTQAGGWTVVGTGDLNGDGTQDVLLQNGGSVVDWIMGNGGYQSGNILTTGAAGWSVVGTGDYNADGTADVLLQNGDSLVMWTMRNGAYQSGSIITTALNGARVVGTGDYNGDGVADIALVATDNSLIEWLMATNGTVQAAVTIGNTGGWNTRG